MYADSMLHIITHQLAYHAIPGAVGMMIYGALIAAVCWLTAVIVRRKIMRNIREYGDQRLREDIVGLEARLIYEEGRNGRLEYDLIECKTCLRVVRKAMEMENEQ